jgi:hypothetical protein
MLDAIAALLPPKAATPDSILIGLAMAAGQCVLAAFFSFVTTSGPWHAQAGFTAHQLVYLPLALYVTYLGCTAWFSATASTPSERILGANAAGLHLSQLQLSVLLLWDIPTGFAVKALRDPIMLCHHVGFAVTAYAVTQTCNETYALVFFGVVEFSSIWLAFADVFHPRQKEYSQWLETAPVTRKLNDAIRALFVLSYMVVRAFYFPYVVWGCYTPDMRALLQLAPEQRQNVSDAELWLPFFLGSAFSVLQLYWAQLLVKQLRKMMLAQPDAAKKSA